MFDWNDEELTNIIWGEAGASDDHIVPFPDSKEGFSKKKEWGQESSSLNSGDQNPPQESYMKIGNFDNNSSFEPDEGATSSGLGGWPNISMSNSPKADTDYLGSKDTENVAQSSKFDSSTGNDHDGFADYQWDRSFDDLDQILSNDDLIFGNVNLGNADELWSSSKDVNGSPVKSFVGSPSLDLETYRETSELFGIKEEYLQEDHHDFALGFDKECSIGPEVTDHLTYVGTDVNVLLPNQQKEKLHVRNDSLPRCQVSPELIQKSIREKDHRQSKHVKERKKFGKKELKCDQDHYVNCSTPLGPPRYQFPPQEKLPEPLFCQQANNQFVQPTYGNVANSYMPGLPHFQTTDSQRMLPSFEIPMENSKVFITSKDSSMKNHTLTPQEKIEKLRRRQQMQAMLAIQKQQQKFGHGFYRTDPSISHSSQENVMPQADPGSLEVEDLANFPKFNSSSSGEHNDSNTTSMTANDYTAEDAILCNLQEVVAKLDGKVRLCIRDSLYRLAQTATQRHFASDSSSSNISCNDDHSTLKDYNNTRTGRAPEVETESNPIDRTVAHLLFHRPMELSSKRADTPGSPASAMFQNDHKVAKSPSTCSPRGSKERKVYPGEGSRVQFFEHGMSGFRADISENTSINEDGREQQTSRQEDELLGRWTATQQCEN